MKRRDVTQGNHRSRLGLWLHYAVNRWYWKSIEVKALKTNLGHEQSKVGARTWPYRRGAMREYFAVNLGGVLEQGLGGAGVVGLWSLVRPLGGALEWRGQPAMVLGSGSVQWGKERTQGGGGTVKTGVRSCGGIS